MENYKHTLTIENKSKVYLTDVIEVLSFSDKEIKLKLKDGNLVLIEGNDLKILAFDNTGGDFSMQGRIINIKYRDKSQSIMKKVFK